MTASENGLELARALYVEVVAPVLATPHTACLIGEGSEVLGYDTQRSTDHEWGPRMQIFVERDALDSVQALIETTLPDSIHDLPSRWLALAQGKVAHHIEIEIADHWLAQHLPMLPAEPDLAVWLAAPNNTYFSSPPEPCFATTSAS